MFDQFNSAIENILQEDISLVKKLTHLRDLLRINLSSDKFKLNCVDTIIDSIVFCAAGDELWNAPSLYTNDELNYSIRVIFWPAFYENNPHKHKTWSVTGVFYNILNVNTYEMLTGPDRLRKLKKIQASMGEVGYLLPGCIHNISNPSHNLSASIHIFNNLHNIQSSEENAIWYPSPRKHNLSLGLIERALTVCLCLVRNIKHPSSFDLIKRIYRSGGVPVKWMALSSLHSFDAEYAKKCFFELTND